MKPIQGRAEGAELNQRGSQRSPVEAALRHLGTRGYGMPVDLLEYAIRRAHKETGKALAPLTEPAAVLEDWAPRERAHAIWQLIQHGVVDPDVGPTPLSRRRHALKAAFRLQVADIREPWGSSLNARFKQLRTLKAVFGVPTSTQPMEMAWSRGVRALATYLEHRFNELQAPEAWERYRPEVPNEPGFQDTYPHEWAAYPDYEDDTVFRQPSKGAQPVFVNLFTTTVFMKKRVVYRRITERLLTAQADGVEYYTARASSTGHTSDHLYVSAQALWGCRAESVPVSRPGEPVVTQLWFPKALQKGQMAHFASETMFEESIAEDRDWVNVNIDHHGIARGQLLYDNRLPVRGLTIRIRFDESYLPETVWWYAELTERERYNRPPKGDDHLLTVVGKDVQKTFTEQPCQPRESYGIAFTWPAE